MYKWEADSKRINKAIAVNRVLSVIAIVVSIVAIVKTHIVV